MFCYGVCDAVPRFFWSSPSDIHCGANRSDLLLSSADFLPGCAFTHRLRAFRFSFAGKTKILCAKCQKKCSGEVLRVTDKYFHKSCFQCVKCSKSLAIGGFFSKDNNYYCVTDYQKTFGTKCAVCQDYVEGEVVSTMGNTYHQKCFTCTKCNQPFESGSKVISFDSLTQVRHLATPECTLTLAILNDRLS